MKRLSALAGHRPEEVPVRWALPLTAASSLAGVAIWQECKPLLGAALKALVAAFA